MYFLCGGTFLVEIQIVLHLEGLNTNCHLLCHISSCRRSSCNWAPPSSFETTPYNNASSAKSLSEDLRLLGRSFTYSRNSSGPKTVPCGTPHVTRDIDKRPTRNSSGPKTVPCGTPHVTGEGLELWPWQATDWVGFVRRIQTSYATGHGYHNTVTYLRDLHGGPCRMPYWSPAQQHGLTCHLE